MTVRQLGVLGGAPAFAQAVSVGRPNIGNRAALMARLNDALDRKWLTNHGVFVGELEQRIADLIGVSHCVAVCNATLGLELAVRALGLTGEVIVPGFTFVATAHALSWVGLTPVFADIDPDTCTLDPAEVERRITPRTSGILGVHVFGRACDIDELTSIADRHHLALLFDAAHAFRCSYHGEPIGNFGRCEVFSFHATKFFNTLEGGAVVTNDDQLAAKLRAMRDFGYAPAHDSTVSMGTNAKMNEMSAAMGLTGLESLDSFIGTNRAHYERYRAELSDVRGLSFIELDPLELNNYQYVIARVDARQAGLTRDEVIAALRAENVLTRPYFNPPCHRLHPYAQANDSPDRRLPVSEALSAQVLAFPTGTGVSSEEVSTICALVRTICAQAPAVREALAHSAEQAALAATSARGGSDEAYPATLSMAVALAFPAIS